MVILNVTPDSFSDGGEYLDLDRAVAHGLGLADEGADLVDVGGESTRPGAQRAEPNVELDRVIPVIEQLSAHGVAVSIDTMRAEVAVAAVQAGAVLVNDVSGGLADAEMLAAVADLGVDYVAMHWRGYSDRMAELAVYDDVVADVVAELHDRLAAATSAGIRRNRIILDPGLGFAKTSDHNWALLHRLDELATLGCPLLIGASGSVSSANCWPPRTAPVRYENARTPVSRSARWSPPTGSGGCGRIPSALIGTRSRWLDGCMAVAIGRVEERRRRVR